MNGSNLQLNHAARREPNRDSGFGETTARGGVVITATHPALKYKYISIFRDPGPYLTEPCITGVHTSRPMDRRQSTG